MATIPLTMNVPQATASLADKAFMFPDESSANQVFFTVDNKWNVTYWNKASELVLQKKRDEILGKNFLRELVEVLPVDFFYYYSKLPNVGASLEFRDYWQERNTWYDVVAYRTKERISVSLKPYDPTNEKQAFISSADVLGVYQISSQLSDECLWEWNLGAKEVFWINGTHKKVFGFPFVHAVLPESFFWELIHEEDRERVQHELHFLFKEQKDLWETTYRIRNHQGNFQPVKEKGKIFYNDQGDPLRIVSITSALSEEYISTESKLKNVTEKLQQHTNALILAQENERQYIGTEISDNLNQMLSIARFYLQMSVPFLNKNEVYLHKCNEIIGEVLVGLRDIVDEILIPDKLMTGLYENIKDLSDKMHLKNSIKVHFSYRDLEQAEVGKEQQLGILRMIQMELNDIKRKGTAAEVFIKISRKQNDIELVISYDGQELGPEDRESRICSLNIESKALQLGGGSKISFEEKGVKCITILIPIYYQDYPL